MPIYRIHFQPRRWTPYANDVFHNVLRKLRRPRSAQLYFTMYDLAWHSKSKRVEMSIPKLASSAEMDTRTLQSCLSELEQKGHVVRVHPGKAHSPIDVPKWRVPLTEFGLHEGHFVPVPRFIVRRYCKVYPNAVLLIVLQWYQHLHWRTYSYVPVAKLAKRIGWTVRRTGQALRTMGPKHRWEALMEKKHSDLPWPMEIRWRHRHRKELRHFYLRVVEYSCYGPKSRRIRGLGIPEELRRRFKIKKKVGFESDTK